MAPRVHRTSSAALSLMLSVIDFLDLDRSRDFTVAKRFLSIIREKRKHPNCGSEIFIKRISIKALLKQ